jgi:lipoprotein signal peptidase
MSQEHVIRRRGWLGIIPWALLVVASIILMVIGLWRSMFILGYHPAPEFVEDARVGNLYLLGASTASIAAALWSYLRGHPHWVTALVAAPAVVVGGVALVWPYSLLRHLVALLALPGAMAGMIGGLIDRGYRRIRTG